MSLAGAVLAAVLALGTTAHAQKDEAKELFDRGAAHYQNEEYPEAAAVFEKLYQIAPSTDVLFAWAQAERFSDNCEKAVELFEQLLDLEMSDANRKAVDESLTRCNEHLAKLRATRDIGTAAPPPDAQSADTTPSPAGGGSARVAGVEREDDLEPAWYKDPIGGALTATGVVGLGLGIGFYISGSSANSDAETAQSAAEFAQLKDRAQSRGRIGFIGITVGTVLIAGGVTWYVVDPLGRKRQPVTAWVNGDGAGIGFAGRF